jgi:phosphoribosyl 1,2-cyclic phosphodiesterase
VQDGVSILLDVSRDFLAQSERIQEIDAALLTHAHRDACGGLAQLRRWLPDHAAAPVDVLASRQTIGRLRRRHARLEHCHFIAVRDGERQRIGRLTVSALTVPHALDPDCRTFAWKVRSGASALVYASDVARLTSAMRKFSRRADLLVIDGALWGRRLFSHLTIDQALPELCRWPVERILLTQIGRSVPIHEKLEQEVRMLCPRAQPAYDGMTVELR